MDGLAHLRGAKIEVVVVHQEFRKVKEFWNELTDILQVLHAGTLPAAANIVEKAVGNIEAPSLER